MEIFPEYGTGLTDHTKIEDKINDVRRAKFFITVSENLCTITLNIWVNCQIPLLIQKQIKNALNKRIQRRAEKALENWLLPTVFINQQGKFIL